MTLCEKCIFGEIWFLERNYGILHGHDFEHVALSTYTIRYDIGLDKLNNCWWENRDVNEN